MVNSIMFYLSGVGLAIFLDLLLLAKRRKSRADWILACWLLIIALHLSMFTFFGSNLYPQLLGLDLPLPLLHGPFLYLYTRALTGRRVSGKHLLMHLALPLAFYLYLIPFISLPAGEKIFVYENEGLGYETFLLIRAASTPTSGVVYILLSLSALRRHRRAIVQQFSTIDKVNLAWLQNFIIGLATIWVLVLVGDDNWIFSATVVFTFFIGFFGIRQGVIFNSHLSDAEPDVGNKVAIETKPADINAQAGTAKYQKSGLSAGNSKALHHRLNMLMASEKLYRSSEFSLTGQSPSEYMQDVMASHN
jgi:hypothetical protein